MEQPSKTPRTQLRLSLDSRLKQVALRTAAQRRGSVSELIAEALRHYLDTRRARSAQHADLLSNDSSNQNKTETAQP